MPSNYHSNLILSALLFNLFYLAANGFWKNWIEQNDKYSQFDWKKINDFVSYISNLKITEI